MDDPRWERNSFLYYSSIVFVPQLEQALVEAKEGSEFWHLRASLFGEEFMNPH